MSLDSTPSVRRKPGRPRAGRSVPAASAEAEEDARANILRVAGEEFAANGLSGARVDAIARRTRSTKGMIYYYFGSKEELYVAVLEEAYRAIRIAEEEVRTARDSAVEAARALVEASFDFHADHPHVGRLISIENIHEARHLKRVRRIREQNVSAISAWRRVLDAGRAQGLFRDGVDAVDLHALVSSLCVYRVTNRATFRAIFDMDFADADVRARQRAQVVAMILGFLCVGPAPEERLSDEGSDHRRRRVSRRVDRPASDRAGLRGPHLRP